MRKANFNDYKLIISDFDGTLVDTFNANYKAYLLAFNDFNLSLSANEYAYIYGHRWDKMCELLNVPLEYRKEIHKRKGEYYKNLYNLLKLNNELLEILKKFQTQGGLVAIASTATKETLLGILDHFNIKDMFDYIVSGKDIINPKPNPEIHYNIIEHFSVDKNDVLVIEDSKIGFECAINANIDYIDVNNITKWN